MRDREGLPLATVACDHSRSKGECSTCLFGGADLGYQEIEMLEKGMFEHRLLFAGGTEFVIRFADLQLDCVDLKETSEQPQ